MGNGIPLSESIPSEEKEARAIAKVILWIKKHWFIVSIFLGYITAAYQAFQALRHDVAETKIIVQLVQEDIKELRADFRVLRPKRGPIP